MKKQSYWFKVSFGKWEDGELNPEVTYVYIEAWDAIQACRKGAREIDDGEVILNVEYLGYPQLRVEVDTDVEEDSV